MSLNSLPFTNLCLYGASASSPIRQIIQRTKKEKIESCIIMWWRCAQKLAHTIEFSSHLLWLNRSSLHLSVFVWRTSRDRTDRREAITGGFVIHPFSLRCSPSWKLHLSRIIFQHFLLPSFRYVFASSYLSCTKNENHATDVPDSPVNIHIIYRDTYMFPALAGCKG